MTTLSVSDGPQGSDGQEGQALPTLGDAIEDDIGGWNDFLPELEEIDFQPELEDIETRPDLIDDDLWHGYPLAA